MWDSAKAVVRGMFIILNAHIRRKKNLKFYHVGSHSKVSIKNSKLNSKNVEGRKYIRNRN